MRLGRRRNAGASEEDMRRYREAYANPSDEPNVALGGLVGRTFYNAETLTYNVSDGLAAHMKEGDITVPQLASAIHVSAQRAELMLSDNRDWRISEIALLAAGLGLRVNVVFSPFEDTETATAGPNSSEVPER